jgi:hypothetical protein
MCGESTNRFRTSGIFSKLISDWVGEALLCGFEFDLIVPAAEGLVNKEFQAEARGRVLLVQSSFSNPEVVAYTRC